MGLTIRSEIYSWLFRLVLADKRAILARKESAFLEFKIEGTNETLLNYLHGVV